MNRSSPRSGQAVADIVNGVSSDSLSESTVDVINPSTGACLFSIPEGCAADVDRAVSSSRAAFSDFLQNEMTLSQRKKVLHRFADLIEAEAYALDAFDAAEMGKPVKEPRANASEAAGLMRFYAESVDKVTGTVYGSDNASFVSTRRVPRGVVAAIVPWNFPTFNAALKLGPALAAGNCVVLKPSELSSRSGILLAQLALEAGLPPGVLNVVPGLGRTVGRALGLHMDVDMVSFTGSTAVGKQMLQYAGQSNMKVVMNECGGKSPQIVFDDGVDLDVVAESIAKLLLVNQGQLCSVGSRVLVQRSIESTLIEKIAAQMSHHVMGDALDLKTTFGPLASAQQCSRVMGYIETAQGVGAQLVMGGRRALLETGGFFVEPTIFRAVPPASSIAQEEIFGPVLSVISFQDEAEAIRIANSTIYGLVAYVWTANLSRGMRMAKGIRSSVLVNAAAQSGEGPGHALSLEPAGQSGVGIEGGIPGMESYLRRQLVWISHE